MIIINYKYKKLEYGQNITKMINQIKNNHKFKNSKKKQK